MASILLNTRTHDTRADTMSGWVGRLDVIVKDTFLSDYINNQVINIITESKNSHMKSIKRVMISFINPIETEKISKIST